MNAIFESFAEVLEFMWYLVKCLLFAVVVGLLLVAVARADPLYDACWAGNLYACAIINQQQIAQAQNYQAAVNNLTNYLIAGQQNANRNAQAPAFRPFTCTQQGVFMVCQ